MSKNDDITDCWEDEIHRVFDYGVFAVERLVNELARMDEEWATEGLAMIASEYVEGSYEIIFKSANCDSPSFIAFKKLVIIVEKKGWNNVTIKAMERCTNSKNNMIRIEAQLIYRYSTQKIELRGNNVRYFEDASETFQGRMG